MQFVFKAKDKNGETKEGTVDARNGEGAVSVLKENGLIPIFVAPAKGQSSLMKSLLHVYEKVNAKDLIVFFRQLAIMVEARVPIATALTAINEQTVNRFFNRVINEIISDIEDGMPLSSAMEKHKEVFPSLGISIIRSGETSGNLRKSMDYVAENIERNYNLSSKVKSALIYPGVIMTVFLIIGFLVSTIILPKLTLMIKELDAAIPWYTNLLVIFSDFMQQYWWAVLIVIFGVIGSFFYYIKTENGRREFDQVKIKIPVIGLIFQYVYITRFSENLAVLLAGGIPIIKALTTVSSVIQNVVYEKLILKTAEEVKVGGTISSVLRRSPELIPPMVSHMIKIGEESGQIESVLNHVAKFYEGETETMTKNLSTLLEPVLMVIIGIAVAFMAFAVLMPIYDIAGQIK